MEIFEQCAYLKGSPEKFEEGTALFSEQMPFCMDNILDPRL